MYKKLVALLFAVAVAANVNAKNVTVDAKTLAVQEAIQKTVAEELVKKAKENGGKLTQKDVQEVAQTAYAAVALRNNEKLVWAAIGAAVGAAVAGTAVWYLNKSKKKDGSNGDASKGEAGDAKKAGSDSSGSGDSSSSDDSSGSSSKTPSKSQKGRRNKA